jgi:hypothetical protein
MRFTKMRRKDIRITIAGTPGAKIVAELIPYSDDHHVIKNDTAHFSGPIWINL